MVARERELSMFSIKEQLPVLSELIMGKEQNVGSRQASHNPVKRTGGKVEVD